MRSLLAIAIVWLAFGSAAWAQPSYCPNGNSCHGTGQMAMSGDGRFIAFAVLGQPANQAVVFDTSTRQASLIVAPAEHAYIGDLNWSGDGDELTFMTGEHHIIGGDSKHIWRLRLTPAPVVELLAVIPCARLPILTADGARFAVAEAILDEPSDRCAILNAAYAVYERRLGDGAATRRSIGQARFVLDLRYDRFDALYIGDWEPTNLRSRTRSNGSTSRFWMGGLGERFETAPVYRVAPGESLPDRPTPMPLEGASRGMSLGRPLDDGRIALYGEITPTSPLEWYDAGGQARRPSREFQVGYIAYAADRSGELIPPGSLAIGDGISGGSDVSSDARYTALIVSTNAARGVRRPSEIHDHQDRLFIFDRGSLALDSPVADVTANASRIQLSLDAAPIMPNTNTEPRVVE